MSPSGDTGQEGVQALATASSPCGCRADLIGAVRTHRFRCLGPCQLLPSNIFTGVPLLVLHVLEIPQVTV